MPAKIHGINVDDLIQRHLSGESVNKLAQSLGVARITINRWFAHKGFKGRNASEAEALKWAHMTPEQRQKQVSAAHAAVRGKVKSPEFLNKCAKTKEKTRQYVGKGERELKRALEDRGLSVDAQRAFYRYNIDLAIGDTVAVEVLLCTGGPLSRKTDRRKIVELLKNNWLVIYIWANPTTDISRIDFKYLASLVELFSRDPALRGKYFMLGANGKMHTPGGYDLNKVARILASKNMT